MAGNVPGTGVRRVSVTHRTLGAKVQGDLVSGGAMNSSRDLGAMRRGT